MRPKPNPSEKNTSTPASIASTAPLLPLDNFYQPPHLEEEDSFFSDAATTMSSSSPSAEPDNGWRRFFFSPCTTKSIMEEAKLQGGDAAQSAKVASFYEESITMVMSSEDPYRDFRASMEEMVAAHELREWRSLQELLHCYLRLNERKNHKVIVLAFVDLLMHLMDQDKEV